MDKEHNYHGKRSKVALFIPKLSVGGSERQLVELAKGLDKSRWHVMVVTMYEGGALFEEIEKTPDIKIIALKKKDTIFFTKSLLRIVRQEKIDILCCYLLTAQFYSLFIKMFYPKVKLVFRIGDTIGRGEFFGFRHALLSAALRSFSGAADFCIFNSRSGKVAKDLSLLAGKTRIVNNGIDTERFRPRPGAREELKRMLGLSGETLMIGVLSNVSIYKDHMTFIKAAKKVRALFRDTHFVIIGDCESPLGKKVRKAVRDLGMEMFFTFMGACDNVESILPGLDVVCSSSVTEGFSNAIAEGMACGVPCVVTDVGDSAFIAGKTGSVVPPRDPEALAGAILKLTSLLPEERREAGKLARKRIVDNFNVVKMVKLTEDAFLKAISCGRS